LRETPAVGRIGGAHQKGPDDRGTSRVPGAKYGIKALWKQMRRVSHRSRWRSRQPKMATRPMRSRQGFSMGRSSPRVRLAVSSTRGAGAGFPALCRRIWRLIHSRQTLAQRYSVDNKVRPLAIQSNPWITGRNRPAMPTT